MFYRILIVYLLGISGIKCCLEMSDKEIKVNIGETKLIQGSLHNSFQNKLNVTIDMVPEHDNIDVTFSYSTTNNIEIHIVGLSPGKSEVTITCKSQSNSATEEDFLLVQVHKSRILDIISIIMGWLYFFAWSTCFYPQLYENYRRKSVVGLNFDTVLFGVVGYVMYNIFNVAMVYVPLIKRQYSQRYPHGIAPVLTNDLVFSMHGVIVTSATACQCFIYYKEKQKVSPLAAAVVALCGIAVTTSIILTLLDIILWLDVVYVCSYIKMYGNVMLYVPQLYMNYKRRSTTGFSILGILIDFLGGIFSMFQIFLDCFNYDDWKTVFENPTKFGIGAITLAVSVVFIVQHYILYRKPTKEPNMQLKG